MIGWEAAFFIMIVVGVGMVAIGLVCGAVELGCYVYKKRSRRQQNTPLPW